MVFTIETSASAALTGSVALYYASDVGRLFWRFTFAVTGPRSVSLEIPLRVRQFGSMVIVSSG